MNKDYLHIGLAVLGGILLSFGLYMDLYRNNPRFFQELIVTATIFTLFYLKSFKDCSQIFKTRKSVGDLI